VPNQDVELSLAVRDGYGNAVIDLPPGALRAVATGAEGATHFQAAEVHQPSLNLIFRMPCFACKLPLLVIAAHHQRDHARGHQQARQIQAEVEFRPAQVSNSKKQHYMRTALRRAGEYALAVSVTDPVTGEPLPIAPHGASGRLVIVPGPLDAARTQLSGLPDTLTAGAVAWPAPSVHLQKASHVPTLAVA
jgi:hypothetical protein